jgi:hypothetical protein
LTIAASGTGVGEGGTAVSVAVCEGVTETINAVGGTGVDEFIELHAVNKPIVMIGNIIRLRVRIHLGISNKLYPHPNPG